jgi:transcriptional regulator with XRE-family HTH domain
MTLKQLSLWNILKTRTLRATRIYGAQSKLARHLGISRQALNAWLSGAALPTAENTLQLLHWVEAEEVKLKQQKSNPERVSPRSGRKTQNRKSTSNEKPKSSCL